VRKSSKKKSSLLTKYSTLYEKKPKSRVFAPLAETYRKLGMIEESLKILRQGIKYHPEYTLGYIVLAHVYYDRENFELSYSTLRPFVSKNLENITLQKLFAKVCINLGHLEEALQTFKYLLLINPRDEDCAKQVKLLEDDLLINENKNLESSIFSDNESTFEGNDEEWVQVNFSDDQEEEHEEPESEIDEWVVKKPNPLDSFKEEISSSEIHVKQHSLDDEFFHEDYDNRETEILNSGEPNPVAPNDPTPIITHTLVDLYCKQKHFDKAIDILESILELHPHDEVTENKLYEVRQEAKAEDLPEEIANINVSETEIPNPVFQDESMEENLEDDEEFSFSEQIEAIEKIQEIQEIEDIEEEISNDLEDDKNQLISLALENKLNLFLNGLKRKASEHTEL